MQTLEETDKHHHTINTSYLWWAYYKIIYNTDNKLFFELQDKKKETEGKYYWSINQEINPLHGRENNVFTSRSTKCFKCIFSVVLVFSTFKSMYILLGTDTKKENFLKMISSFKV